MKIDDRVLEVVADAIQDYYDNTVNWRFDVMAQIAINTYLKETQGWVVINIGCLECDVPSEIMGLFASEIEANKLVEKLNNEQYSDLVAKVFSLPTPSKE
jgi:hypothetical protein